MSQHKPLRILIVLLLSCGLLSATAVLARSAFPDANPAPVTLYTDAQPESAAAVSLAARVDDAGYALLPASEQLGGERDVMLTPKFTRIEWDGEEGNPASLDETGLGGVDLTWNGHDHFRLNAAGSKPAQATLWVYTDAGQVSRARFPLATGISKVPFAAFAAVQGSGADFTDVGAIALEITGNMETLALSDLVLGSSFQVAHLTSLSGNFTHHTVRVTYDGAGKSAPVRLVDTLARGETVAARSIHATRSVVTRAADGALHLELGMLAAGETAVVTYQSRRAPTAVVPVDVIAQEGTPPPGNPNPVTGLNVPFTDGNGKVGFTGSAGGDGFVWYDSGIRWLNSSYPTATLSGGEAFMGVGNNGEFIYSPSFNGDDSVWSHNGLLLVENTQAPGFPTGTNNTFNSRPTMIPDGTAYWISGFNESGGTSSEGRMFYASPGALSSTITVTLRSDDNIGGLLIDRPSGVGFDYHLSNDGNHHVHELLMDTGGTSDDGVVYLDGTIPFRESFPSGSGDNWDNFDYMSINDQGNYLFSGDTDGATTGDEFIAYNGVINLREGDLVGGMVITSSSTVRGLSLNNLNQAVHLWGLSTVSERLFFACDAANLADSTLVLAIGDMVDVDGNGVGDATVTDFNTFGATLSLAEDGYVYVDVDIDDGNGDLEAILRVALPACAPPPAPSISLTKTVGSDAASCAATDTLLVPADTAVTYCYEILNTGNVTLTLHDLADEMLGTILNNLAYTLTPGTSTFLTQTATVTTSHISSATWQAYNPGPTDVVSATDTTTVTIAARLQVAHLAPFAAGMGTAVTVTLDSTPVLTNFSYQEATTYLPVPPGTHLVEVYSGSTSTPAITATVNLSSGMDYLAVATGDGSNQPLSLLALPDDNAAPMPGMFKLRLGHLAPFAAVVTDTLADVRLQDGTPVLTNVVYGSTSSFLELPAGTYDLKITTPGGNTTLIDPEPATFNEGDIISAFAVGDGTNQELGVYALPAGMPGYPLPLVEEYLLYLPILFMP